MIRHADIWSGYVEERAHVDEIAPRIASLEAICSEEGRDPATIGRSIGVLVNPFLPAGARLNVVSGSAVEIAAALHSFLDAGVHPGRAHVRPGHDRGARGPRPRDRAGQGGRGRTGGVTTSLPLKVDGIP